MQNIIEIEDSNFNKIVIDSKKMFLIEFWATWCNPCKIIAPTLEIIAQELKKIITVAKINIENNPITVEKYKILSIPSLLIFNKGVLLSTKTGILSKEQIKNFVLNVK